MEIVKFFHFLGLMLGAAAGFGSLGVAVAQKKLGGGPPPDVVKKIKPILGMFGLSGIVLLWLTGLVMVRGFDEALGALFSTKLVVAAVMLLISLWMMYQGMKAAKSGTPPPAYMDKLGRTSGVLSIIAVALAVAVFG